MYDEGDMDSLSIPPRQGGGGGGGEILQNETYDLKI